MKAAIALFTIATFFAGEAVVQVRAAACPVCHSDPCTCGKGKHDRTRVGVGVSVDLSGVGRRRAEADPFAVPVESSSSSQGEKRSRSTSKGEEKKTKTAKESTSGNLFAGVQLTGEHAKDVKAGPAAKP